MEILIAVLISSAVSALIAKIYVVWCLQQVRKDSEEYMKHVQECTNRFYEDLLSRINKL